MAKFRLLLKNISQLVAITNQREKFLLKEKMNAPLILFDQNVAVGIDGNILKVWPSSSNSETDQINDDLLRTYLDESNYEKVIDCTNKSVVPGLVDGHTHPVWTGDRVEEFAMKLAGATYLDIHNMGGGIGFTVRHVREASESTLKTLFKERLKQMTKNGTTLLEAKSGYGLNCDTEIKMLKVIHEVKQEVHEKIDIVGTWLGGHSYPKDISREEYNKDILEKQIPTIAELKEKNIISPEFADVFMEKNVFDRETTKEILVRSKSIGLGINFHGDELSYMGSGELAGEIGATAVSHLEHISEEGINSMAENKVCAVLLPTTAYMLRIAYPPARKMIEGGVPVCLASDFNPNAHCLSLPYVMNLSCVNMHMTMAEAIVAVTLHAAASIGKSDTHGSIEEGKVGDFVIVGNKDWRHLIYELIDPPIENVIKRGKIVYNSI